MPTRLPDHALERLAEAIADGLPLDLDPTVTTTLSPRQREAFRLLGALRGASGVEPAPAARAPDTPGDGAVPHTWGPFRLLERLGSGAWGEVWRAFDSTLQKEIAVKLVRPDALGRAAAEEYVAEARRLARIRHPNVLQVYGADVHDGRPGLWCELIRGRTLDDWQAPQGRLAAGETVQVGAALCRALSAVHQAGLVHRDIKASNVMREDGGRIVLMDFGAGAELAHGGGLLGDPGNIGTALYMAPERIAGRPATPASDLFALGVLLFRLLTGEYPFDSRDLLAMAEGEDPTASRSLRERRPDLSGEFVLALERALARDPAARYPTAAAMERALLTAQGIAPGPEPVPPPVPRPWRAWAIAGALAGVAGLAVWLGWPHPQPSPEPPTTRTARVTPAPAPPALDARATLVLVRSDRQRALGLNDAVRPGDHLALDFQANDSCYVYVLDEDDQGRQFRLFPIRGVETTNPLAGGASVRLPGSRNGVPMSWSVTSYGGGEGFYVVASRSRLTDLERKIASIPEAGAKSAGASPEASAGLATVLRGIGGLAPLPGAAPHHGTRFRDLFPALMDSTREHADLWVWQTKLRSLSPTETP